MNLQVPLSNPRNHMARSFEVVFVVQKPINSNIDPKLNA